MIGCLTITHHYPPYGMPDAVANFQRRCSSMSSTFYLRGVSAGSFSRSSTRVLSFGVNDASQACSGFGFRLQSYR